MIIHPKTSGAALGGSLGVLMVAVLQSISGVHMSPELPAAITGFLSILGAYFAPASDVTPVTRNQPLPPPTPISPSDAP